MTVPSAHQLRREIIRKFLADPDIRSRATRRWRSRQDLAESTLVENELRGARGGSDRAQFFGGDRWQDSPQLEAIIRSSGRPSLLVRDDRVVLDGSRQWRSILTDAEARLHRAILSVARVDLIEDEEYLVGSCFVVAPNWVVTNRHVASRFAQRLQAGPQLKWISGAQAKARVNFRCENRSRRSAGAIFTVCAIRYLARPKDPDIAVLEVDWAERQPRTPLLLDGTLYCGQRIAAIGHPAADPRVDADEMRHIFRNIYEVKRVAPGEVMHVGKGIFCHDATTLGGNSGSAVVDLATGSVVGLHFGGASKTIFANHAIDAKAVRQVLQKLIVRSGTKI